MVKILFLYFDPHFINSAFAKSVGADFLSADFVFKWTKSKNIQVHRKVMGMLAPAFLLPRGYDVYFCEGTFVLPVIAKKLRLLPRQGRIVNTIVDPLVYYLHAKVITGAKRRVLLNFLNEMDGFTCLGKMEKELLSEFVDKPAVVVDPFIPNDLYNSYSNVSPDLRSHRLVFVARGPDWFYKGIDLLVNGFRIAKQEVEDLELNVVGDWSPKKEWLVEGVKFVGIQKSLIPYFAKSSLYVHIGRGEAFGISILEAMLSGLPAIVSKWTGAKEAVKKLGDDFIVDIYPEDVAEKIMKYFDLSLERRMLLSKKARKAAAEYGQEKKIELFQRQFQKLMDEIK